MAFDFIRKSITREADGTLSIHIAIMETIGNKELKTISAQGPDADALESALLPILQAEKNKYDQQKALDDAADLRIANVKTALGF